MIIRKLRFLFFIFISFTLAACAMNNSVPLPTNFWQQKNMKIVVARAPSTKPRLYQIGSEGIIDYVINKAETNRFSSRLAQFNMDWYPQLQNTFYKKLKNKGMQIVLISESINYENLNFVNKDHTIFADRDFGQLRSKLNADELLLIRVNAVGAIRRYYGFIPLSPPAAYCDLQGDLIDLKTNRIIWRGHGLAQIPISGNWDEPPLYPSFMEALKFAVQSSSQQLTSSFFKQ